MLHTTNHTIALSSAPEHITQYHELVTQYNEKLPELWNNLTPAERVFAYYMYRASLVINHIYADQTHRHAREITRLFEHLVAHKNAFEESFNDQVELFLIYLYAHHSQYFLREHDDHKRTPARMGLELLTPETLIGALEKTDYPEAREVIERVSESLFNAEYEPTVMVAGDIEKSAGNMYSRDFTNADFETLSQTERAALNLYFYNETVDGTKVATTIPYKIGGKNSEEMNVAHYWLAKAQQYSQKHPEVFDAHVPASLAHLIKYVETGNEDEFRKFSIEWLRTNSRIDFNWGFIEVYQDPKHARGSAAADLTIKTVDMTTFNALLPALEKQLPFPKQFMRENLDDTAAIPNASVNAKIFAAGDVGPVSTVAAYCLPNYNDIRAQYGSKQIMYQASKSMAQLINPQLSLRLGFSADHVNWLNTHDPHGEFMNVLNDALVMLHETLGHGSGKLDTHTFVAGDPLTIDGTTYKIGDTLALTNDNTHDLIGNYASGLEELRAEILALYTSIFNFDELNANGMFKDWVTRVGKDKVIEWLIVDMARAGFTRLVNLQLDATEITQAHAQADGTILNYLLDHGGLVMVQEKISVNDKTHTVLDVHVPDIEHTVAAIKELAIEVQRIKSTADGQALNRLMKTYGACIRHPEYIAILKANREAIVGIRKEIVEIFPLLTPVMQNNEVVDISAHWPASFLEQQQAIRKLSLNSK